MLVALAVMLALVAGVGADDAKPKKANSTQGMVEKLDLQGKTLTVKTGKKKDTTAPMVTLSMTDATKVVLRTADGEKEGTLSDVTIGQRVNIKKETKDGKEVVAQIIVIDRK
jgi:Cu/Ag efflux protein CusF